MAGISYLHRQMVAFTPAHIQLACDGLYLALPLTRTSVGVWSLQNISCKPLELLGHSKILTTLALGNVSSPKLLVSAAADYVIVWNLQRARQQLEKGEKIKGRVVGTTLGSIQYCSFSPDDSLVAACSGLDIIILHVQRESTVATLEGHDGAVTGAEFCPHYTSTLVSISDDRTFKVWNLDDLTLVYQSTILTASPFLSVAMSFHTPHMAIGTADGIVRVYDLTDGNGFRCLHQIDVAKYITKQKENKAITQVEPKKAAPVTISSRPSWQKPDKYSSKEDLSSDIPDMAETGHSVLGLYFTYLPPGSRAPSAASLRLPFLHNKTDVVKDLLDSAPILLVGTTAGLLQVNTRTLDVSTYVDFQEPITCSESIQKKEEVLNAAGSVIFGQSANCDQSWCIVGSPFKNVVHILQWKHVKERGATKKSSAPKVTVDDALAGLEAKLDALETRGSRLNSASSVQSQAELTVLSTSALLDESPLRSEFSPRPKGPKDKTPREFVSPQQKKGKVLDNQPLTFKSKVKSSGYTEAPRMTMFKPQTGFSKPKLPSRPTSKSSKSTPQRMREYPTQGNPPTIPSTQIDVAERPVPVNCIKISRDGQGLACALSNKSTLVFSLPISQNCSAYTGHNHTVTHVDWSQTGSRLLTSSADKTASLWVKGQSDPVMTIDRVLHNFSPSDGQANKPFGREVNCAQFYYMDKFILMCSGSCMYLYKYHIDSVKNEIKRYLPQSRYKLVQQWSIEAQHLTAMSTINGFYSYIVLCAGSNKTLEVYDMNVGAKVRHMGDVHTRPVHAICQNKGSQYVSHHGSVYDLFATASAGDCIKLWDLRTNRCVRRYEGHLNRVHPCGLAFSPCGRFIATGSEDKSTYVFDMRSGTYIHKLTGHTDVVSDVAFHPLYPYYTDEKRTVRTLIRRRVTRRLIWVHTGRKRTTIVVPSNLRMFTSTLDGKLQQFTNR